MLTDHAVNREPLEVTKPSEFRISAISVSDKFCFTRIFNMAAALLLFGFSRAFFILVFLELEIALSRLSVRFSGLPKATPLAFFAAKDCFVLEEINCASYSAMLAIICRTSLFAVGKSQNLISVSDSKSLLTKATFLERRSSLATISVELVFRHRAKASVSLGRSLCRPLSVSTNSAIGTSGERKLWIISLCASIPSPDASCFFVDCRR